MSTQDPIALRPLAADDLEAAHALSRAVGWPHRLEDWRTMFGLGRGFAAVDGAGTLHGVAMWWPQGRDFATLGMVIVSPALQKAGIGRRLMAAIVAAAEGRRVQLNATAEGLRLYRSFGFAETGGVRQHHGTLSAAARPVAAEGTVRALAAADHAALYALDRRASGVDREALLGTLLELSQGYALERGGALAGTLLVRAFGRGRLLGPLVAENEEAALALLSAAATETGGFLRADIPDDATALAGWLEGAGLARVSEVRTMLRGDAPAPSAGGARIFGLASQALG